MKVVLEDGMTVDCGNYKAVDAGLVLTADAKRKQVIGFVPHDQVQFVLPEDVLTERKAKDGSTTEFVYTPDAERQAYVEELETTVADLRAQLAESAADVEAGAKARHHVDEPENLAVINGIGPTYHERLTEAGITTFKQLRRASVAQVVEATGVSEERAEEWIDATKMRGGDLVPTETETSEAEATSETETTGSESESTPEETGATG